MYKQKYKYNNKHTNKQTENLLFSLGKCITFAPHIWNILQIINEYNLKGIKNYTGFFLSNNQTSKIQNKHLQMKYMKWIIF